VGIAFRVDSSFKLAILTLILTSLYQLEFWGLIAILTLVLISTNWDFKA